MPQLTNSLLNKSKKELAEQHSRLVNQVMLLWAAEHRMQDWVEPIAALQQLQREALDRIVDYTVDHTMDPANLGPFGLGGDEDE